MAVVMTSNPLYAVQLPFSFWVDSVADSIAEMMIEQAVEEMEAEQMIESPEPEMLPIPMGLISRIVKPVIEVKAVPTTVKTTSLAELINNLPEDCSRIIYKKVMDDCIKQIPYRVAMNGIIKSIPRKVRCYYVTQKNIYSNNIERLNNKMRGIQQRMNTCKNKEKAIAKIVAYDAEANLYLERVSYMFDMRDICPPRILEEDDFNLLDAMRD